MEIWRDIKGYEGLYQISNKGRVKSLGNNKTRKEKIRDGKIDNTGYKRIIYCMSPIDIIEALHLIIGTY